VLDADGDGRPERVEHYRHGVLRTIEIHSPSSGHLAVRQTYGKGSRLVTTEYDKDGDGTFERVVEHDEFEEPRT
jgi:hypothetical protein